MSEAADHDLSHLPPAAEPAGRRLRAAESAGRDLRGRAGGPRLAGARPAVSPAWARSSALCRPLAMPHGAWGASGFAIVAPMWGAMTLAMMLPSAAPMILTYAEIADTAARKGERIVSPFVLAAGYTRRVARLCRRRDAGAIRVHARRAARRRHGIGERAVLRRDLHRRRRLPVLRAQARLPHAMPAAVPVLLRQLGDHAARRVPARRQDKASIASAAAGR